MFVGTRREARERRRVRAQLGLRGAAGVLVRHFFNLRHRGRIAPGYPVAALALLAALAAAWPVLADWGIGGIGYAPAFLALSLYALLPVVANTVLGLEGIPGDVIEAARGMGLTERQVLTRIRWPLALPTIVTS